jgi:hypothetical protein
VTDITIVSFHISEKEKERNKGARFIVPCPVPWILALKLRRYVNQSNVYSLGDEKKLTISTPQTTN